MHRLELRRGQRGGALPVLRDIMRRRDASASDPTVTAAAKAAAAAAAEAPALLTSGVTVAASAGLSARDAVGPAADATAATSVSSATSVLCAAHSRGGDMRVRWACIRAEH